MSGRLVAHVRVLLRAHQERPGRMDERAARSSLYPSPRLIDVAPIKAPLPLNQTRPTVGKPGGARGEHEFGITHDCMP